ncbi:MAG: hypothetical protein HYX76_01555, partial [Acidobacteria bacterium]|nr:hypothetical protein [Acidobacteriota bacterium]
VRLVLRNEQPGVTHDFVAESLGASIEPLKGVGSGSVVFRAPNQAGRHDYVCTPHSRMMNGTIVVGR